MTNRLLFYPDGTILESDSSVEANPDNHPAGTIMYRVGVHPDIQWCISVEYTFPKNTLDWEATGVENVPKTHQMHVLLLI